MVKLLDRYLLKELIYPFLVAVSGFIVFTLLILIGQFSQMLIDGILPTDQMIILLIYKVPFLAIYGLPFATLFAIFLALGRLGHDREIIAMQASGASLRRIVVPFVIFGLLVSIFALFVSDRLVPLGNRQFTDQAYNLIFNTVRGPEVTPNTFFKAGDEEIYVYGRSSDSGENALEDVLIFENSRIVSVETDSSSFPRIITAERAEWAGQSWKLYDTTIFQISSILGISISSLEVFTYNIDREFFQLSSRSRSGDELSIPELAQRVESNQRMGLSSTPLLIDLHLRVAIPVMCLIFALFGAPLAILIGTRGRAIGVILAVLLILLYIGILFWTAEILGARGDIHPALGAWLPNMLFGVIGILLFLISNRFGKLDLKIPFKQFSVIVLSILAFSLSVGTVEAQETRLPVEADLMVVDPDSSLLHFIGSVTASYRNGQILAEEVEMRQLTDSSWEINALRASFEADELSGEADVIKAQVRIENDIFVPMNITLSQTASVQFPGGQLWADRLSLDHPEESIWDVEADRNVEMKLVEQDHELKANSLSMRLQGELDAPDSLLAQGALAEVITGETGFTNAQGRGHRVRYGAQSAELSFNQENELEQLNLDQVDFTTCTCTDIIENADYSINAGSMLIRPDQVLAAFSITFRLLGQAVFWAPAYVAPLGDLEQQYPFLPEVGSSSERGWFAKWRLPFYVDENTFGHVIFEYYSRFSQVGTGLDLNYRVFESDRPGRFSFRRLVGNEESLSVDWQDSFQLNDSTSLGLFAGLRTGLLRERQSNLRTGLNLTGNEGDWTWGVALFRDQNIIDAEAEEDAQAVRYLSLSRLPEISLSRSSIELDELPMSFTTRAQWGRYREESVEGDISERTRFDGAVQGEMDTLELFPGVVLDASGGFQFTDYEETKREALQFNSRLNLNPTEGAEASISYLWRQLRGRSPFQFDQLDTSNQVSADVVVRPRDDLAVNVRSGYNWIRERYTPLTAVIEFHPPSQVLIKDREIEAQIQVTAEHDLNTREFQGIDASARIQSDGWSTSIATGYSFTANRFRDLIARVDFGQILQTRARFDLDLLILRRISLQTGLEFDRWEVSVGAEIDVPNLKLATSQFSIVRNFCDNCWNLRIYGDHRQISFQAGITAFPTAGFNYSPTDQGLSFGR